MTLASACSDDGEEAGEGETSADQGDGDGDTGDGDGDTGDGDGDTGDGDGDTGDGDGDTGDGDGDTGDGDGDTGDGDGDGDTGDGDGDTGGACADIADEAECDASPDCQSVLGQPLIQDSDPPCLDEAQFLGCIPTMGCGDALTWFCVGDDAQPHLVFDTCGPEGAEECDPGVDDPPACG